MYERPDPDALIKQGLPVDTFDPATKARSLIAQYDRMYRDQLQKRYEAEKIRDEYYQSILQQQAAQAEAQSQSKSQAQQAIQQQSQTGGSEDDGYSWWQKGVIGDILRSGANIYPSILAPVETLARNSVGSNPDNLWSTRATNWINNEIPISQEEIDEQNRLNEIEKREGGWFNWPYIKELVSLRNLKHAVPEAIGSIAGLAVVPAAVGLSAPEDVAALGTAALTGGALEGFSGAGQELINKDINREGIPTWQELGTASLNIPVTALSYKLFPHNIFGKGLEGGAIRRAALGGLEEAGQEGIQNVAQEALSESTNNQGQFDFNNYNLNEIAKQGLQGATLGGITGGAFNILRGRGYSPDTSQYENKYENQQDINLNSSINGSNPSPDNGSTYTGSTSKSNYTYDNTGEQTTNNTIDFGPINNDTKEKFNAVGVNDSDLYDVVQGMPGSIKNDINNLDESEIQEAASWINNGNSSEGYNTNPTMNTIKDHVNAARDSKFDNFMNQIRELNELHDKYADIYNGHYESTGDFESDVNNANQQLESIKEAINNKVNDINNQRYNFKNDYDRTRFIDQLNNIKQQSIDTIYSKHASTEKNDIDNLVIDTNSKLVDTFNNLINKQVGDINKVNIPKERKTLSSIDLGTTIPSPTSSQINLTPNLPYRFNKNLKTLYKPRKFKVKRINNKVEDRILEVPTFQDLDLPKYSKPIGLREFQDIQRQVETIKRNQTRYVNKRARELETNLNNLLLNKDIDINELHKYTPQKLRDTLGYKGYRQVSNLIADINTYRKNNHIRLADEFKLNIPRSSRNDLNKYAESHLPSFSEWDRVNNRYEGSTAEPVDDTDADTNNGIADEVGDVYSGVELSQEARKQIDEYNKLISDHKDDLYVMSQYKHRRDQVYNAMKYKERLPKFNPFVEINKNFQYGALPREARKLLENFSPEDKGYIANHLNPLTDKYTDILAKKYGKNIDKAIEHANLLHRIINRISHMDREEYSVKPIRGRRANQDEVIARSFEPYAPLNQQLINLNDVTSMRYQALLDKYGLSYNTIWAEVSPKYQPGFIKENTIVDDITGTSNTTNEKYLVLDGRYDNDTIESEILAQALMNGDRPLSPEGYREDVSFYNKGISVEDNFATEGFGNKLSKFLKNIGSDISEPELKAYMLNRDNSKVTGELTSNNEVANEVANAQGDTIDELINHIPNQDMQARFKNYYNDLGKNTESFSNNLGGEDLDQDIGMDMDESEVTSYPSPNETFNEQTEQPNRSQSSSQGFNQGANQRINKNNKRKIIREEDVEKVKKEYRQTNESNDGDGLVSVITIKESDGDPAGFIRKLKDHSYVVDYRGGKDGFQSLDQAIKFARENLGLTVDPVVSTFNDADDYEYVDFNLIQEPTRRKLMGSLKRIFGNSKQVSHWLSSVDKFLAAGRVHHIDKYEGFRRTLRSIGKENILNDAIALQDSIKNNFLSDRFAHDPTSGAGRKKAMFAVEEELRSKHGWGQKNVDAIFLSQLNREMGRRLLDEANIPYTEDTLSEILDNPNTFSKAGQTKPVVTFTGHMAPDDTPDISGEKWQNQFLKKRSRAEQVLAKMLLDMYVDYRKYHLDYSLETGLITKSKYDARMRDKFWVTTANDVDSSSYQLAPKYGRVTLPENVLRKSITLLINEVNRAAHNQTKWTLIKNLHKISGSSQIVINPKRIAYTTRANEGKGQNTEIALQDLADNDGGLYSIKSGDTNYQVLIRDKLLNSLFEEDLPRVWEGIRKFQSGRARFIVFTKAPLYFIRDLASAIINSQAAAGELLENASVSTMASLNGKMLGNTAKYFQSHINSMFSKSNQNAWQTDMWNRLFTEVGAGVDFSARFGVIPKTLRQSRTNTLINRYNTTYKLATIYRNIADNGAQINDILEQGFRVGYMRTLLNYLHQQSGGKKEFKNYGELRSFWNSLDRDTQLKLIAATKRITLNYDQHGDATRLRAFYMFYNTTMQGLDILTDAAHTPWGLICIGLMGALSGLYYYGNRDKFKKVDDVYRLRGLPLTDDYLLPLNGEHAFIVKTFLLGTMAGEGDISNWDAIKGILKSANEDLSPVQYGRRRIKSPRDIGLNFVTMTGPLDPILEVVLNTTPYGDIVPPVVFNPATGKNEKLLNHLMYNKGKVGQIDIGLADFLYKQLGLDISPNQIDAFTMSLLSQWNQITQHPEEYYANQINIFQMPRRTEMSKLVGEVADAKETLNNMTELVNSIRNQGLPIPKRLNDSYEAGKKIYNHMNYIKSKDTKNEHVINILDNMFREDPKKEFSPQAINVVNQVRGPFINWNKTQGKKIYEEYENFIRDNQ